MTVSASPSPPRRRFSKRRRTEALVFLALALPNLVLIGAFTYRPLVMNIYFSTLHWTLGSQTASPAGLDNYTRFFTTDAPDVLRATAVFAVCTVGGSMLLGLLVALALNQKVRGRTFARAAVFAPYVLSGVGVGLVWLFIFDPVYGVFAYVLRAWFSTESPSWFNDPDLALTMVILVYVWKNLGYCAVVYLAGLQGLSSDVMEAAAIDGATSVRRFWHVSLPLLGPTTFFLTITTLLSSLQAFDLIRIMTPASPGTRTLIYEAYVQSFGAYQRAGYSAAISVVLFVILITFTIVQIAWADRRVHYS